MESTSITAILIPGLGIVTILVAVLALWIHKKAAAGNIKLIGEAGEVETKLDPVGTVIVCGELWRARTQDGASVEAQTRVRVVGIEDHLALVEILN